MLRQLILLAAVAVSACGSSVVVAEKPAAKDGGLVSQEGATPPDGRDRDASDEVVTLCGHARCPSVPLGSPSIPGIPCCSDPEQGICGVVLLACIPLGQVGRIEPSCTPVLTPIGTLQGCCRPDGTCGALDTQIGFGCAKFPSSMGFGSCVY